MSKGNGYVIQYCIDFNRWDGTWMGVPKMQIAEPAWNAGNRDCVRALCTWTD